MNLKFLILSALAAFCLMGCSNTVFQAVDSQDNKVFGDTEGSQIMEINSGGGLALFNDGDGDNYSQSSIGSVMAVNADVVESSTVATSDSQTQVKLGFLAIVSQSFFSN